MITVHWTPYWTVSIPIVFLDKMLNSHITSLHPGVKMATEMVNVKQGWGMD